MQIFSQEEESFPASPTGEAGPFYTYGVFELTSLQSFVTLSGHMVAFCVSPIGT